MVRASAVPATHNGQGQALGALGSGPTTPRLDAPSGASRGTCVVRRSGRPGGAGRRGSFPGASVSAHRRLPRRGGQDVTSHDAPTAPSDAPRGTCRGAGSQNCRRRRTARDSIPVPLGAPTVRLSARGGRSDTPRLTLRQMFHVEHSARRRSDRPTAQDGETVPGSPAQRASRRPPRCGDDKTPLAAPSSGTVVGTCGRRRPRRASRTRAGDVSPMPRGAEGRRPARRPAGRPARRHPGAGATSMHPRTLPSDVPRGTLRAPGSQTGRRHCAERDRSLPRGQRARRRRPRAAFGAPTRPTAGRPARRHPGAGATSMHPRTAPVRCSTWNTPRAGSQTARRRRNTRQPSASAPSGTVASREASGRGVARAAWRSSTDPTAGRPPRAKPPRHPARVDATPDAPVRCSTWNTPRAGSQTGRRRRNTRQPSASAPSGTVASRAESGRGVARAAWRWSADPPAGRPARGHPGAWRDVDATPDAPVRCSTWNTPRAGGQTARRRRTTRRLPAAPPSGTVASRTRAGEASRQASSGSGPRKSRSAPPGATKA